MFLPPSILIDAATDDAPHGGHLASDAMGFVHVPDPGLLTRSGFGQYAGVPVIFLDGPRYARELNSYLRERALLEWHPNRLPGHLHEVYGRSTRLPVQSSLLTMARQLLNFAEWTEWAGVGWREIEYSKDLVGGYQADMNAGRWSAGSRPLSANTVNQRVSAACDFLTWAGVRGTRPPFSMKVIQRSPRRKSTFEGSGSFAGQRFSRLGSVRWDPSDLRLPTVKEVRVWLEQVEARYGFTKALMCQTVLGSAARRREVVEWRTDYLPELLGDWKLVGDKVSLRLVYGTKGDKPRNIRVSLAHAERLHRYREFRRLKAAGKWIERHPGCRRPSRLFLSEHDGEPISAQVFYNAWTGVPALPFKGWSPHLGRHYWACTTLLEHLSREAELAAASLGRMPQAWLFDVGLSSIQTIIQPQLGHSDSRTCEMYLRWIATASSLTEQYLSYQTFLDADDGGGGCR